VTHDGPVSPGGGTAGTLDEATALFAEHRKMLFAIVYNLLGTVSDTEDVLQDTWLSWASARRDEVANARAYLVRIAVNGSLARMRDVRLSRESYVGPWLPEPLLTEPDTAETAVRAESVSLALMVVLETLTPLERAVFVLREAFGYDHAGIAGILGRSPAAVRQLAHRAREHVRARRPRYEPDPAVRRAATERFLAAALGGDLNALMEVLAPDVTMRSDSGGKRWAALRVIEGRDRVARLLAAISCRVPAGLAVRYLDVNGGPAALLFVGDELYGIMVVDLSQGGDSEGGDSEGGDRIRGIYSVLNPDKLTSVTGTSAITGGRLKAHGDALSARI